MRIAVLADIHGNLAALEAVLADVARHSPDVTVNLGDSLSGPLQPAETADRLIALGLPTIRGNHERQLLTLAPEHMGASDAYADTQITAAHRAWLTDTPETLRLGDEVFLCHGTPTSDLQYFLHTVEATGVREASDAEAAERAGTVTAAVILCGHTHLPRIRRLGDQRLILNPGSVGLPAYDDDRPHPHVMEAGTPHARYALLDRSPAGDWSAEIVMVDYDRESAALAADARGRPDWARALRTGRM